LTHGPGGEYSRHLRHEETSSAVTALWRANQIRARALWLFAYDDGGGQHLPVAASGAHRRQRLSEEIWQAKYGIITEIYGFCPGSLEARMTPRVEAFWCFASPEEVQEWLAVRGTGR